MLVGIVSWGLNCASHTPGVYTNIEHFHEWIEKRVLKKNNSSGSMATEHLDGSLRGNVTKVPEEKLPKEDQEEEQTTKVDKRNKSLLLLNRNRRK